MSKIKDWILWQQEFNSQDDADMAGVVCDDVARVETLAKHRSGASGSISGAATGTNGRDDCGHPQKPQEDTTRTRTH